MGLMKDIQHRIEKLLSDAEDCSLISKLATNPAKREAFQKLAIDYRRMALELEAIIINDAIKDDHGE
jgi:hypothetical protein